MPDSDWSSELVKIGYEAQQRFDSYAVVLTFTILGLAVQTAHFGYNDLADVFELASWCLLLLSGLGGMARLAWTPKTYQFMGLHAGQQDRLTALRRAQVQGTRVLHALDTNTDLDIDGVIVRDARDLDKIDKAIKSVQGKSQWAYYVRSVAFLAGVIVLMMARGLAPLLALLESARSAT